MLRDYHCPFFHSFNGKGRGGGKGGRREKEKMGRDKLLEESKHIRDVGNVTMFFLLLMFHGSNTSSKEGVY